MRINKYPEIPNVSKFLKSGSENSSSKWRTQINQTQLVSQASTILLQRHPKLWPSLLKPLQISSNFTPSLFHQILNRIRTQPKLCYDFFNWARKNLDFKPDIGARCELTRILFGSELSELAKKCIFKVWSFIRWLGRMGDGVLGNHCMWSVVAKILYKDGKFERIGGILKVGVYSGDMFDLMIDGYSRRGDFGAALDYLHQSTGKGIEPSFSTYSSILDGACRYNDEEVIENVLSCMVEKGHILKAHASEYDFIIKKLCGVGKTFAMDLFFKRACDENAELEHATYECMFMALLCEDPSLRISNLLVDIIRRGVVSISPAKELSSYVRKLCAERQWREAEELLDLVLDQEWSPDPQCCGSFVRRYCSTRQIDRAILLHNKLEELKGTLATDTYNILVAALLRGRRSEEAIKVFDYMKRCKTVDSESFALMIRGLCEEKEMRMAMKLHDEMLELGLKPDQRTYKRLITGFR
ncbi:pentatricopeptide repeat-containing protein [Salvia divinorum]|uniref:Pentatricopeptide repeat-containing protein n=1 Tax=Salvia divinorum TaxID=28513 RepID=A0ABD1FZU5_SALDI